MKKSFFVIIIIFVILIGAFTIVMLKYEKNQLNVKEYNRTYEQYNNKIILGSDVASIINKAINTNEENKIKKNDKGMYINNNTTSIHIFIKLKSEGEYYPMETIASHNITKFVENFSLQDFKCSKITYHNSTKLVENVYFDIFKE